MHAVAVEVKKGDVSILAEVPSDSLEEAEAQSTIEVNRSKTMEEMMTMEDQRRTEGLIQAVHHQVEDKNISISAVLLHKKRIMIQTMQRMLLFLGLSADDGYQKD